MRKIIPYSECERHQPYIDAFRRSNHKYELAKIITRFIFDPNMSPSNEEDLEIFRYFLFDSGFRGFHIQYYADQLISHHLRQRKRRIKILRRVSRYAEFLYNLNQLMIEDLYHHVILIRDLEVAADFFLSLPPSIRATFVHVAGRYPSVVRAIPKLKLYITFS